MHVRCPHCANPIEIIEESSLDDVVCPSCGSNFSLISGEETASYEPGGDMIGHFRLVRKLGAGAFGTVWRAIDTKLDRTVALKVPRKDQLSTKEAEKFFREARTAGQLRHPNIVSVHEVGREDDTIYIASDLIDGLTLSDWLSGQQLTSREAAELCAKIGDALHHAHEAGVVHRDLKPGNIMMGPDGEPNIMDFGLAKREAGEVTMTRSGEIIGTPAYMAPEQARGDSHAADRRSDIYSLGVILFELLTGERPFRGNVRMLVHQVVYTEPPSPRSLNATVPRDLETLCLKCLQKPLERRCQTALEFSEELRRYLNGQPIHARPVSRTERLWRWCRRNPIVATLSAAVMSLLIFLAVAGPILYFHEVDLRGQAETARGDLEKSVDDLKISEANAREATKNAEEAAVAAQDARDDAEAAESAAQLEVDRASLHAQAAGAARDEVIVSKDEIRRNLYFAQMNLAQQAFDIAAIERTEQLLDLQVPDSDEADFRGFEWYYLWHQTHRVSQSIPAKLSIRDVGFSPDDSKLVICGEGNDALQLWDVATEALVHSFDFQSNRVFSAIFSPDGSVVAAADDDGGVVLWDVATGAEVMGLPGHESRVWTLAFSPDGESLASAGTDRTIKIWDVSTGTLRKSVEAHGGQVSNVKYSPDGTRIASGSFDHEVKLWDAETLDLVTTLKGHTKLVYCVAFTPDGAILASGGDDKTVKLWDTATGTLQKTLAAHSDTVSDLAFSSDGQSLATASNDRTVRLWDASTGTLKDTLCAHRGPVRALCWKTGGLTLATVGSHGLDGVNFWNLRAATHQTQFSGFAGDVKSVAFSPVAPIVAAACEDRTISIRNTHTGEQIALFRDIPGAPGGSQYLVFSPDGQRLVAGNNDHTVKIWSMESLDLELTLEGHSQQVTCVAFAPDQSLIASASSDGTVKLWDTMTGDVTRTIDVLSTSIAFSHNGNGLAVGEVRGGFQLYDTDTGKPTKILATSGAQVSAVAISKDDRFAAAAYTNNAIKLWDIASETLLATLTGHANTIMSIDFAPDGRTLASASADQTVKLWSVPSGQVVSTLTGHSDPVFAVAFSLDGSILASAGRDKTVRLWRADGGPVDPLSVRFTQYSPDGNRIATWGNSDKQIRIWDAATQQLLIELGSDGEPSDGTTGTCFSPDSRLLAVSSDDHSVRIWDLETGILAAKLQGHTAPCVSIVFIDEGRQLVSCGNNQLIFWDATTWERISSHPASPEFTISFAVSPDGRKLACGAGRSGEIHVWDLETKTVEYQYSDLHANQVVAVRFADNDRLVSGGWDGTLKLWSLEDGGVIDEFDGLPGYSPRFDITDDGRHIVCGAGNAITTVITLNNDALSEVARLPDVPQLNAVGISPDGQRVITGNGHGTAIVWNATSGQGVGRLVAKRGLAHYRSLAPEKRASQSEPRVPPYFYEAPNRWEPVDIFDLTLHQRSLSVVFSTDGELCAAAVGADIRVWDTRSRILVRTLVGHEFRVNSIAFSPNGRNIASGSADSTVRVWDVGTGETIHEISNERPVDQIRITSDGAALAYSIGGGKITVWDIATRSTTTEIVGPKGFGHTIRLVPGKELLATSNFVNPQVRYWSLTSGESSIGPEVPSRVFSFSADGKWMAWAKGNQISRQGFADSNVDGTITIPMQDAIIWLEHSPTSDLVAVGTDRGEIYVADMEKGTIRETRPMRHILRARALAWSPDGKMLATAGFEGVVKFWNPETGELLWRPGDASSEADNVILILTAAIERVPPNKSVPFLSRRASEYVRRSEWQKAASDYHALSDLQPEQDFLWLRQALLLAAAGEVGAYHKHCSDMLGRFANSEDRYAAEKTAKCCLLIPDAGFDLKELMELADRGVESTDSKTPYYEWLLFAHGLASYREGRFEDAITSLEKSREHNAELVTTDQSLEATDLLLIGMCRHHLGDSSTAQSHLIQASDIMKSHDINESSDWIGWVQFQIIYRESQAVIPSTTPPHELPEIQYLQIPPAGVGTE